jgi:hypothetical protein
VKRILQSYEQGHWNRTSVADLMVLLLSRLGRMGKGSLEPKIESAVPAMLLVAGAIWYSYAHCELGSTRDSSFLVAYRPVGAESLWIHHERVQAGQEHRIWINNPRYLQTRAVNSINYAQADHVSGRDSGRKTKSPPRYEPMVRVWRLASSEFPSGTVTFSRFLGSRRFEIFRVVAA